MNRMRDLTNKCTIWNFLAAVSAVSGLGCFGLSFTYKMSFGKLGIWGLLVYLLISSIMLCLIYLVKGIEVKKRFQVVVVAIVLLVVICLISVELDKLVPGKSDALSIISYGLLAILSLCASRKFKLGFETGFFTFFLSLVLEQTYKTNLKLFPIAVIFCSVMLVLRYRSYYGVGDKRVLIEFCSKIFKQLNRTSNIYLAVLLLRHRSPNGEGPLINATIPETDNDEYLDLESQSSLEQSLLPPSNQENNPGESYEAAHNPPSNTGGVSEESTLEETRSSFPARRRHSPINDGQASEVNIEEIRLSFPARRRHSPSNDRQVSEESISDGGNEQNNEREEDSTSSLAADSLYPSQQDHVSSANYQNGHVHSSPPWQLRRRRRMTRAIQNISSTLGDTPRRWHPPHLFSFFLSFFFFNPR